MGNWTDSVIWWHCYPLRFVGGEERAIDEVHHRLGRLTNWLDYVIELGCNGLLLAPIFASASHGYDTLDHFRIDPRLGDSTDFDAFMHETKRRGLRVCLDGVFNHVSRDHDIVRRALADGPDSEAGRWLRWDHGYPVCFEGNLDLVELNFNHGPVADYIVSVMTYWLARGIDGWRLDAAYAAGAPSWLAIIQRVKRAYPEAWILAEVIHGDYTGFVEASGVDSLTQYELWKSIWSSLNDPNMHELAWTLKRHDEFCQHFRPQTFIGNHDVTRIATKLTDPRHLPLAVALLLLLPGIPSIYAGDEQGFTGEKQNMAHGDDAVRPQFPATPAELLPYGANVRNGYAHLISVRRQHPWLTDASVTTSQVGAGSIVVELRKDGRSLRLGLNATDLPVGAGNAVIPPHSYLVIE